MVHQATIQLQVNPAMWQLFARRKQDKGFLDFQQKVFQRDQYKCQYCGFQAHDYQEIINRDQDYNNNKLSNLMTCCVFCAQCFFIESVGVGDYGGGTLIYLPEISQIDLNSLCHVLFCAIANGTAYKTTAQSIYRNLKFRSQIVEKKFGEGTSNPAIFGQLVMDNQEEKKIDTERLFDGIRLLPSRAKFRKQIETWATTALDELVQKAS